MTPPTEQQVLEYMATRGMPEVEGLKFHAYHESRGWVVGKSPMKSWEAACRTWELNYKERQANAPSGNGGIAREILWSKELEDLTEKRRRLLDGVARDAFGKRMWEQQELDKLGLITPRIKELEKKLGRVA